MSLQEKVAIPVNSVITSNNDDEEDDEDENNRISYVKDDYTKSNEEYYKSFIDKKKNDGVSYVIYWEQNNTKNSLSFFHKSENNRYGCMKTAFNNLLQLTDDSVVTEAMLNWGNIAKKLCS